MHLLLLTIVAGLGSHAAQPTKPVGRIELNHFYDDCGKHNFTQIIAWEWMPDYRRWYAARWRIVDGERQYPVSRGGVWHAEISQGEWISSKLYKETWTTYDPEREDRKLTPEAYRSRIR